MEPPPIGKMDLERARSLLSQARNTLELRQWTLLDGKLAEAERAFERFNKVASASGKVAQVARGAEGVAAAGRASAVEGTGPIRGGGPLLVLLILFWPAPLAGPEHDHAPEWLDARMELEEKLREVSRAAQEVEAELVAARRAPEMEAAKRRPPRKEPDPADNPKPRKDGDRPGDEPPCFQKGSGGSGPSKPGGPKLVTCRYDCGGMDVTLTDVPGTSGEDCQHPAVLRRAAREAARKREEQKKLEEGR
jgi:hypothetical protein